MKKIDREELNKANLAGGCHKSTCHHHHCDKPADPCAPKEPEPCDPCATPVEEC